MDDKGFLFNYFMKMIEDKKLAQRLRDIARMRNYFSGESILEAGHKTNYVCMVVSGLVRGFYIDEEGNDRTKCFSMKGNWCCSYNYLSDIPCPFFVEAELDSVLAEFNIHDIERLKKEYPMLGQRIENLIADSMMKSEERIHTFISLEAKDRYLMLMKEQPDLVARAKQEHIASYLGITPSSLSRIKRNV